MSFKINLLFVLVTFSMFYMVYSCFSKTVEKEKPKRPSYCEHKYDYGNLMECRYMYDRNLNDIHDELRFYFNINDLICEMFAYGGCGGNDNNFKTWDECMGNCSLF